MTQNFVGMTPSRSQRFSPIRICFGPARSAGIPAYNTVNPCAHLAARMTAIVNGHKQSRIEELLPWNIQ